MAVDLSHEAILSVLERLEKRFEPKEDILRNVGLNVSTGKPFILDYKDRSYVFVYSPNTITLTVEDYGTVSVPANTWVNLNFMEGTRIYLQSGTSQQVLVAWTEKLLSMSSTASVSISPNASVNVNQVGGAAYALGSNNMAHSEPVTIATDDTVMAELLLDTDNLASILTQVTNHTETNSAAIKSDLDTVVTNTNKLIAPSVSQGTIDATTQRVASGGAATGTKTNVASSATSVTILAANTARKGALIYNDSTQILYLDLSGGTASSTSYTTQIGPNVLFELPGPAVYNGAITGIWAAANGNARVTELT